MKKHEMRKKIIENNSIDRTRSSDAGTKKLTMMYIRGLNIKNLRMTKIGPGKKEKYEKFKYICNLICY